MNRLMILEMINIYNEFIFEFMIVKFLEEHVSIIFLKRVSVSQRKKCLLYMTYDGECS